MLAAGSAETKSLLCGIFGTGTSDGSTAGTVVVVVGAAVVVVTLLVTAALEL